MTVLQDRLRDELRIYLLLIGIGFRSRMQYRADFIFGIAGVLVLNAVNLSLIWVMISRFQSLAGWTFWEIVMLYSMWLLSHSIYSTVFWHLRTLEEDIIRGRFDQYMVRPVSPLVQFLGREVQYMGFGDVIFAVTTLTLAYTNLGLQWALGQWLFFAVAVVAGLVIETCIIWIIGALAFWFGRSRALFFFYMRFQILGQQYPIDVFGLWFRIFITGFLPIAFMNYYPLTVLLGKENALGLAGAGFFSPLVALALFVLGIIVWRRGLAGYTSSGS